MSSAHQSLLHPPKQRRSERTLERMLVATERLLAERPFEAISVQEIVRAARTSVGAFYTRFSDKTALLPALYERYERWLEVHLDVSRRNLSMPSSDLHETCRRVVRQFVTMFRERRHLLRALALYVRTHPADLAAGTASRRAEQHRFLIDRILEHRTEIPHPEPARAAELAVYFAVSACRDRILFSESPNASSLAAPDAELEEELSRMMVAYLRHPVES